MSLAPDQVYDVVVVGAGAAGIGAAVALKQAGVENFVVLERHVVGASFALWPAETRFITPSFPTNSIGMLDLNSIALRTSPAFILEAEHPTGEAYAIYLNAVAQFYEVPIRERTNVVSVAKAGAMFEIETGNETVCAKHVIWAAGEFQYPRFAGFPGSELCRHTATIPGFAGLRGDNFVIIGGYESGVDAAYHLACRGKRVRLFDEGCPWKSDTSDPSVALSTYSLERMQEARFVEHVELFPDTPVVSVIHRDEMYEVFTADGECLETFVQPLLAGGFEGSLSLVSDLFERREDGFPQLSEHDESTLVPGLFLCGPAVRHDNHVFCFIYKYRQRFAVVAKAIATELGLPAEGLETYRKWGMYLDDLSYCGEECVC
ncbi:MAG: monooxygenase [Myxococcales bacterium FL481]|nr:MAG: monooxygenase [Myxococcales bacterium FL481]